MRTWLCLAVLVLVLFGGTPDGWSQTPADRAGEKAPETLETLVEKAQTEGYRVVLVPPEAPVSATERAAPSVGALITLTASLEANARAAASVW